MAGQPGSRPLQGTSLGGWRVTTEALEEGLLWGRHAVCRMPAAPAQPGAMPTKEAEAGGKSGVQGQGQG